jgi:hypothetical protein
MKKKLVSFLSGVLVWSIGIFGYFSFISVDTNDMPSKKWPKEISGDISDEQLERMSEKSWISKDVIQERLDSWENMRDIMGWAWKWNR